MRKLSEYENKKLLEISQQSPYSFEDVRDIFFEINDFGILTNIIVDSMSQALSLRDCFLNYKHKELQDIK